MATDEDQALAGRRNVKREPVFWHEFETTSAGNRESRRFRHSFLKEKAMKKLFTAVALLSALGAGSALVPAHAQVGYGYESDVGLYDSELGWQTEGAGFDAWYGDADVGFHEDTYGTGGYYDAGLYDYEDPLYTADFGDYYGTEGYYGAGYGEEEGYGAGYGGDFGEAGGGAGYGEGLGWETEAGGFDTWSGDTGPYWRTYNDVGDEGWFDM
jgi:hypothetical protein